jgi:CubicO group peptidase (beta-lactamase class C family)
MDMHDLRRLDAMMESMLRAARIPGAALAIVSHERTILARGYGCRELASQLPMSARTIYPIGSTAKAFNATLIGMLVDESKLGWDTPVQNYLPQFGLRDAQASALVTLRDLVTMRTGLPRHDWMWMHDPVGRAEIAKRARHLEASASFRERFQYNNVTVAVAGHVAEIVMGRSWEVLVREKLLEPLGMVSTGFGVPETGEITASYHENRQRTLVMTSPRMDADMTPAGTGFYSTIEDMARWLSFNLARARVLEEIHTPQIVVGADPSSPTPGARYALGWFVDRYNGHRRISHSGHIHDLNSDVTVFPDEGLGFVSFVNFGCSVPAKLINQYAFDMLMGFAHEQTLEEKLAQYEQRIVSTQQCNGAHEPVRGTEWSHALESYTGMYESAGYGRIDVGLSEDGLAFRRGDLLLPLRHWHYDEWIAKEHDSFPLYGPHAFDPTSRLRFATGADGGVESVSIALEPAVSPIVFVKQ